MFHGEQEPASSPALATLKPHIANDGNEAEDLQRGYCVINL